MIVQTSFYNTQDSAEESYRAKMGRLKMKKSPRNSLE